MHSRQGISKERRATVVTAQKVVREIIRDSPNSLKAPMELADYCKQKLENLPKDERKRLNYFIEFLGIVETLDFTEVTEQREATERETSQEKTIRAELTSQIPPTQQEQRKIIGRVALTIRSQARPTEFEFWAEDRSDLHVEIGSIITTKAPKESGQTKIIAIVTDLYATSATDSPIEDFYSTGYGDASVEPPTTRPVVRVAKAQVVFRDDNRFEPPVGNWGVYFATAEEIIQAYNAEVPDEFAILSGFTWDDTKSPVPIYLDSRFVLGYEGAHVNISGASGLATKTSFALFLIESVIGRTLSTIDDPNEKSKTAAILFNVKEADLMRIDDGPSDWDSLNNTLSDEGDDKGTQLWKACIEENLDPFILRPQMKFFAPPRPDKPKLPLTFRSSEKPTDLFSYGLLDLTQHEGLALTSLMNPDDLDDRSVGVISSLYDEVRSEVGIHLKPKPSNFRDLLTSLTKLATSKTDWMQIGYGSHHSATLNKVQSRLNQAINHQLKGLLNVEEGTGKPVPIEGLKPGNIWVVDISKLHSKGQRLVFTHIYETINTLLEAKRNKESKVRIGTKEVDLDGFPDRVIVFVDELNKFAPSGRGASAIKSGIVDITARGRSVGLSLFGAEQVANQVDEELLSNTSTFVVGRSHALSLKGDVFQWLQGGLRERALLLPKGDMVLWHAIHSRPVLLSFPRPLHAIEGR